MLNDLVSGDAHLGFINAATPASMLRSGQLRAIAAITETRMPDHPDVPTLTELGYPGIGTVQWLAIFAPAGTPPAAINAIHKAATAAVAAPAVLEKFKPQSLRAVPTASPDEAAKFIRSEFDLWRKITTEVKLELPD